MTEFSFPARRRYLGPSPDRYEFTLPGAEVAAMLDVVELAATLMYAPAEDSRDHETPLLQALARFDFVEGE